MSLPFRLGVDLDNTLISYKDIFKKVLKENGVKVDQEQERDIKSFAKDQLSHKWKQVQKDVYGMLAGEPEVDEAAVDFIKRILRAGGEVWLISHKTLWDEYDQQTNLREAMSNLLKSRGLVGSKGIIEKENLVFASTPHQKNEEIAKRNLDVFIDDHGSLFDLPSWPKHTIGLQFNSELLFNWRELKECHQRLEEASPGVFKTFVRELRDIPLSFKRGIHVGNSTHLLIKGAKDRYFNKLCFKGRELWLQNEFDSLVKMKESGVENVAWPLAKDRKNYIYQYVPPTKNGEESEYVQEALSFIERLQVIDWDTHSLAKHGRLSFRDYFDQIQQRYDELSEYKMNYSDKIQNLLGRVEHIKKLVFERIEVRMQEYSLSKDELFDKRELILSPSDFGIHNSFYSEGRFYFCDFEYLGRDHSLKLVCDFYHHEKNNLSLASKKSFVEGMKKYMAPDARPRLKVAFDLIGLEWVLIILNILGPHQQKDGLVSEENDQNIKALINARAKRALQKVTLIEENLMAEKEFLTCNDQEFLI